MLKQLFAGIMEAPGQAGIYESSTTNVISVVRGQQVLTSQEIGIRSRG
jgi:hypothetical protein